MEICTKITALGRLARRGEPPEPMVRKAVSAPESDALRGTGQPEPAPSFEQAIAELEALVDRMEGGNLSLEDSLAAYRRGAELVTLCRRALAEVEQQVKVLEGDLLRPFAAEASHDDAGQ
jgi:exodeoxyribonuclease VII small subunit